MRETTLPRCPITSGTVRPQLAGRVGWGTGGGRRVSVHRARGWGGPDDVIVQSSGAGAGGITMQRFRDLGEIVIHVKAKGAASP